MKGRKKLFPVRTALTYVVFGVLWILLTDSALAVIIPHSSRNYTLIQTIKGWLFVCASAILIYFVLRRDLKVMGESEQRYKLLFESNPHPMWVYDMETLAFLMVNDAAIEHYGYTREEFLGMTIRDIRPVEEIPALLENVSMETSTLQKSGGWKHRKKDRSIIDVEISSHALTFEERPARLVLARDITEYKQAEERLAYQAELLSNVHDAIVGTDENLRVTYWNKAAEELFGWTEREALGRETKELFQTKVPGSSREEKIKQLMETGQYDGEVLYARKDGVYINAHARSVTLRDLKGEFKGLVTSVRDITERKQTEDALRRSEQILREAQAIANLGSWTADLKAGLYYASAESARLMGWEPGIHKMEKLLEVIHPDDRETMQSAWEEALRGKPYNIEYRVVVNGEVRWLHVTAKIVPDVEGKPFSALGVTQDITERKQAEMARVRLLNVLEASLNEIYVFDPDGLKFEYANSGALRNLGYSLQELKTMTPMELKPEFTEASFREMIAPLLRGENPVLVFEAAHRRADASLYPVEVHLQLVETGSERVFLAVINDITQRKQAEEQLRASEERYRRTLDNMLEGCQIIDFDWRYIYINGAAVMQGRSTKEALLHHTMMEVYPGIEHTELFAVLWDCMNNRVTRQLENEFIYPDGTSGWFELGIQPVKEGIFILSVDVTERKRAEERLRVSEERFRQLIENIEEGFWITDTSDGRELYLSPAIERIWGRDLTELMEDQEAFLGSVLPEDLPRVMAEIERQKRGKQTDMEYRIRRPDNSIRWIWDRAFPVLDENGQVKFVTGLVTDITQRKQAEENIERQLRRISALNEIDRAISSGFDIRLSLNILLNETISQLGVDAANVLLLDLPEQTLRYFMGRGFRTEQWGGGSLRLGEGLAGRAALQRRPVRVFNLAEVKDDFIRTPLFANEGFVVYFGVPLIAKGQVKGVLEVFHRSPLDPEPEWFDYLNTLAGQAAIAIDNAQLFDNLQRSNLELVMAYDATIAGWSHAMDLRDKETEGHTRRVTEMTLRLAERMGVGGQEQVQMRRGALLHDIGKLGIPDHILLKPGKLTEEEWALMREHPTHAYNMLLPIHYLRPALDIPYCHHEKWDGSGYPRNLKGEQIPLAARIFAVVDVWDALRSDRPYRSGWSAEKTRDYILAESGKHFDPRAVEAFMVLLEEMPDER